MAFNHVISLGCNCIPSYYLKLRGLKKYSCPFDWLICPINWVPHIISDNFQTFMDRTKMINNGNHCGHSMYGANFFKHYNPLTRQEHHDYYQRCITRFNLALSSGNAILFFMVTEHSDDARSQIEVLDNVLRQSCSNYKLLVILVNSNTGHPPKIVCQYEVGNVTCYHMSLFGSSAGVPIDNDDAKLLTSTLDGYGFDLKESPVDNQGTNGDWI